MSATAGAAAVLKKEETFGDPIVTRLVNEDKTPWYKKPNLRYMYLWLFLCCMGVEMTSGFDSQLINTLQFSQPFNKYFGNGLKDEKGKWAVEASLLGIISSSYQLGSIVAVPIAPWFNNRFGRRWSILVGSVVMMIGALIQGFSQHVGMYIVARILLGMGILFAIISGSCLIGELAHPKERAILTSLFNASYFIGSIIACAIAIATVNIIGDWSWRLPSLLQMGPSVLQIATVFLLPESPRWLVAQDREEEAYAILVKYHAEGDADNVIVLAEMAQIRSTIKLEMESNKQSWFTMVKKAGMRRRVLIAVFLGLFTQMSGNTLLSYYTNLLYTMMGYTTSYAKTRINIANQCWSLLSATLIALFVTRFRRRVAFMVSSSTMVVCFVSMTIAFQRLSVADDQGVKNHAASVTAMVFYFAYSPCYNIGNNALVYTYLIELFPYAVRTRGIGIEQIFGKAGGFFSNFVNPIAMKAIGWKFFAFEFCFQYFMYPETRGRTLEELAFLFEGQEMADQAVHAVEKQLGEKGGIETIEEIPSGRTAA
ncbi:hypothetical protein LTR10_002868 [Elasticomyces elasticus]|nr:hypothetical protein LTR10_002868 [Elasticomyces elasticus]